MRANIIDNQWLYLDNITPWEEEIIVDRFSVKDEKSRYIDSDSAWDGVYRKYSKSKKRLARPFLAELRLLCKQKGLAVTVEDHREPSKYQPVSSDSIDENFLPGITLKPFQIDAIKVAIAAEVGVISVTTGGGKSEVMAGLCKAIACPTLIVAEQVIIIDQLKSRLKLREICEEPGIFYAGKLPNGEPIIIGTIQSLVNPKKPEKPDITKFIDSKSGTAEQKFNKAVKRYERSLKAYKSRTAKAKILHNIIRKCEMIIVDECDLAVGKTYKNLFKHWFKGRRRYGLTGTPYDDYKPVQKLVLQEHLGSVIFHQRREQVEATGLIVPIEYFMLAYEDGKRTDATAYDIAYDEWMVYNNKFHMMIKGVCDRYPDDGKLILIERHDLGHALMDLIDDAQFIYGETPKKQRPLILKAFEDRKKKVLIGGRNVRRGLDLSGGCETLVIATGGKLASEFEQRLGRARRRNQRGKSRVVDFMFLCNKYLYGHSKNRLKAALRMGLKTHIVFNDGIITGEQFVRSNFRRPTFKK